MPTSPIALAGGNAGSDHKAPASPPASPPGVRPPAPEPHDLVDAVELALRATVMIEGDGVYGAGILIDPAQGTVLTSYHVVEDMRAPRVTSYTGKTATSELVAKDARLDLAVLRAPALAVVGAPPPRLGDASLLRAGQPVFAVGMPRKLPFTVSRGIVSYIGREMEGARYVQLDMSINDGNSGGPVLSESGEIVAIMSFILKRSQGLAFALPVAEAAATFPDHIPPIAPRRSWKAWLGGLGLAPSGSGKKRVNRRRGTGNRRS